MTDIATARRALRLYRRISVALLWGIALMLAGLLALPQMARSAEPGSVAAAQQRFLNTGETTVDALYAVAVPTGVHWQTIRLQIETADPLGSMPTVLAAPRDGVVTLATPPIPPGGALIVTLDPAQPPSGGLAVDVVTGLPLDEPLPVAVGRTD
jgi:hypothetical protein